MTSAMVGIADSDDRLEELVLEAAPAPPAPPLGRSQDWPLIWVVGGSFWAVVAVTEIFAFWGQGGRIVNGQYVLTTGARALSLVLEFLFAAALYRVALSLRWPTATLERARTVAMQLLLALVFVRCAPAACYIAAAVADGLTSEVRNNLRHWESFVWSGEEWSWAFRLALPTYGLGLLLIAFVRVAREYHRETLRSANLSMEYANARLATLSAQLQPHFLFNALHGISALIEQNPARANAMLARLGDFLRHALESSSQQWVSVQTELAGLEAYLAIQEERFGDGLRVDFDIDPTALALSMPSLLLQPLAENAVDHGRCIPGQSLHVRITIRRSGEHLRFRIINSAPRLPAILARSTYGYGLSNVDARLRAAYGERASLTVGPTEAYGTQAELVLPLDAGYALGLAASRDCTAVS